MSDEHVIGHVNWSPDFKSAPPYTDPGWLKKALTDGRVKLTPLIRDGEMVSVDLVAADPEPQEEAPDIRPHQEKQEDVVVLDTGAISHQVSFTYTNWKGKISQRKAVMTRIIFGCNEWHPEPQFLIEGYDIDKGAGRTYALKDISDLKAL
jgi:hypothetical protein